MIDLIMTKPNFDFFLVEDEKQNSLKNQNSFKMIQINKENPNEQCIFLKGLRLLH